MRGHTLWIAVAALLIGAASTANAVAQPNPESARENAEPEWVAQLQLFVQQGQGKEARDLIDAQIPKENRAWAIGTLYRFRALTDVLLRDQPAFKADFERSMTASPDPTRHLAAFVEMGTVIDPDVALASVKRLASIDPNLARDLDEMVVGNLLQIFKQGHRDEQYDDLVLALADISYGGILSRDDIQLGAATILLRRGQLDGALDHAAQISGRGGLIDILTDRRFAKIWPSLEGSVGDHMDKIGQANLAKAELEFKRDQRDIEARLSLMRAYKDLGLWDRADELGKPIATSTDELVALNERTAWIIDEHARILAEAGRIDEADDRWAAIVETWSDQRGWVINMAINRISALADAGRYQASLSLLDRQKAQLERYSSLYAKQLIRALRVFNLVALDRRTEAEPLALDILSHADDAPSATLGGLLLLGRDLDAEKLAIKWLSDPDQATGMISFLRLDDSSPKTDNPIAIELQKRFRARPAVQAAFATKGRDLPENLRRVY